MPADMKAMIAHAFVEMTKTRNIDKITVKDLVTTCNISRQTFYYHFRDIIEVLEWMAEQRFNQVLELSLQAEHPEEAIRIFFTFAMESSEMLRKLIRSEKREYLERMFLKGIRTWLLEMFRHSAPEKNWSYAEEEVVLTFLTYGIAGLLMEYCEKRNTDVEKLSHQIYQMLQASPRPIS